MGWRGSVLLVRDQGRGQAGPEERECEAALEECGECNAFIWSSGGGDFKFIVMAINPNVLIN